MAAPTFIASYSSTYFGSGSPKTLSVTTQAGDVLVVYGGIENSAGGQTLSTPSGNGVSFTLQQSYINGGGWSPVYIWTGTDNTGGTNWTLSCTISASNQWGFSCLVFRDSGGIGNSGVNSGATGTPNASVTTTQDNSALVAFSADWNALDGSGRTWNTINSITPTNGNGLERDYALVSSTWTIYGAYWSDAGTAGATTPGLSTPAGQQWSTVAVEIKGLSLTAPILQTDRVTSVTTTTAQGNGSVNDDGGSTVTERGFVWSTSPNPTTSDNKVTASGTTGSYNASLTSLSSGTLYHVRAYATNSVGTGYGIDVTFQNLGGTIAWAGA